MIVKMATVDAKTITSTSSHMRAVSRVSHFARDFRKSAQLTSQKQSRSASTSAWVAVLANCSSGESITISPLMPGCSAKKTRLPRSVMR